MFNQQGVKTVPSRYPNPHPQGAPFEYYTRTEAERAIGHGEAVISFCEDKISRP